MIDLNSLMIFAQVVESGSFSAAARRLKVPISTVSRRIAELEDQLGVRLLERSTRSLRPTDIGSEIFEHARLGSEIREAIIDIASHGVSDVSGTLRISSPPSISDSLLIPLIVAFQASYPNVHVRVFITDRIVDHMTDGVDLSVVVNDSIDPALEVKRLLTYRHQLVASPEFVKNCSQELRSPSNLLDHRLIAFSFWRPESTWDLRHVVTGKAEPIRFQPFLQMNDFAGLSKTLLGGAGIGELPPVVQPELMRSGQLVEVLPEWHLPIYDMLLVHPAHKYVSRTVRLFKEFAGQMAPIIFPDLPV